MPTTGGVAGGGTAGRGGTAGTGGAAPTGGTNTGGSTGGTTPMGGSGGVPDAGAGGVVDVAGAGGSGGEVGGAGGAGGVGGAEGGVGGAEGGIGGSGGDPSDSGVGGEGGVPSLDMVHLYVGCADNQGSIQSFKTDGSTITPIETNLAGGPVSNAEFSGAEDLMYVAYATGTAPNVVTSIRSYTRTASSGFLTALGTPADVPNDDPGEGGAGGAPSTTAPGPQTLTLDAGEEFMAVPNYFGHTVYIYELNGNGTVGPLVDSDEGGLNAHHAVFSGNNQYLLVPYLGSNQVTVYNFDADAAADDDILTYDSYEVVPGNQPGPRHLALHSNNRFLYSINEKGGSTAGSIDFFEFNQTNGTLESEDTFDSPLPPGYTATNAKNGGEIAIAPNGDFLYVSLRLDGVSNGSIAVFAIESDGSLTFVEQESTRGLTPRHFSISSDGSLLAVGNQGSNTVALFYVDTDSGELRYLSQRDVCASPRFARFADIP
jgi:6-phosphogluconolactonase (cycloisomerase 2 family)